MFLDDALGFIYIRQKYPRAVGAGVFVILLLLLSGIRSGEEGEGCEVGFDLELVVFGVYFDFDGLVLVGEVVAFWGQGDDRCGEDAVLDGGIGKTDVIFAVDRVGEVLLGGDGAGEVFLRVAGGEGKIS